MQHWSGESSPGPVSPRQLHRSPARAGGALPASSSLRHTFWGQNFWKSQAQTLPVLSASCQQCGAKERPWSVGNCPGASGFSIWSAHRGHTCLYQHGQGREVGTLTHGSLFGGLCARGWGEQRTWACPGGAEGGCGTGLGRRRCHLDED